MTHHPRKNLRKAIKRLRVRKPRVKRKAWDDEEIELIGPGDDAKGK